MTCTTSYRAAANGLAAATGLPATAVLDRPLRFLWELSRAEFDLATAGSDRYPTLDWVVERLRNSLVSRIDYPILDAFIVGSEARGTARPDSDLDIAVIIPLVRGKTALQISEAYHAKFRSNAALPHWQGRRVDVQFFYPDDPELQTYAHRRIGGGYAKRRQMPDRYL